MVTQLLIDVWSDIACPWCWIGKRRLETALARFPQRDAVTVRWRAFELDPLAQPSSASDPPYVQRLATKYGTSIATAESAIEQMSQVGVAEGLEFRWDRIKAARTFDAHRVLQLAAKHGLQGVLKERFFLGTMRDGEDLNDHETLVRLATDVGLERSEVADAVASDAYAFDVRTDQKIADQLRIRAVPFFLMGPCAVSGAHPTAKLLETIHLAWHEVGGDLGAGQSCAIDGCA